MSRLRSASVLFAHLYRLWRSGQLRFRLETFGLYYPTPPYSAPWWRVSPLIIRLLLRRSRSYATWVLEMESLREHGQGAWWVSRQPHSKDVLDEWNQ